MGTPRFEKRRTVARRTWRSDVLLVIVALIPILLIGYSLCLSTEAPSTDVTLVLGTVLITGVGAFVIWDTVLSAASSVAFDPRRMPRDTRILRADRRGAR